MLNYNILNNILQKIKKFLNNYNINNKDLLENEYFQNKTLKMENVVSKKWSKSSLKKLETCDLKIQKIMNKVVEIVDCTVLEGRRSKQIQNKYFNEGKSKLQWPNSKHNVLNPDDLSKAIDVVPYIKGKVNFKSNQCYYFAGIVKAVAYNLGIKIRFGGDWDRDGDFNDQTFNDLVHFELDE